MRMKDSGIDWIGEIPQEWKCIRAKNIFVQSLEKGNTVLELLSATQNNGVVPKAALEGVVQVSENADLTTFKTVHKGDYVISLRSFQGGFEMSNYEGVITSAYTVFRAKTPINNQYFKMLFKCDGFISKMNSLTVGIREGKNIMFNDFANTYIPLPSLDEQQRIAEFLEHKCTKIDATIEKEQQVIEKLKEYKRSIITEAVTKGLNSNVPMKESGIDWVGEVPEAWESCRLRDFAVIVRGGSPRPAGDERYYDGDIPFMKISDITKDENVYVNECESSIKEAGLAKTRLVPSGTLLLTNSGATLGIPKICTFDTAFNDGIAAFISFNKGVEIKFLYYFLKSRTKWYLEVASMGQGQPNLNINIIGNTRIFLPPIQEQKQIVNYLDKKCNQIDSTIEKKQRLIEKLADYKKSLIYEAVTGKLEV